MDVASQLRNGCERNGKMGSIVCGMMLQMLDIVKGQDPRNFSDNLDNNLNSAFPHLLEKYRSCFKPVKDNMFKSNTVAANEDRSVNRSNNSDIDLVNHISSTNVSDTVVNNKCDDQLQRNETSIVIPKRPIGQSNASCLRKRPMVEKIEEKCLKKRQVGKYIKVDNLVLPNKKAASKKLRKPVHCSFCQQQGHKKTNCPMKHGYGDEQIGLEIIDTLLHKAPFSELNADEANHIIFESISNAVGVRHLVCHSLHVKWRVNSLCRPTQDQLVLKISLLNKYGKPHGAYSRCLVNFRRVVEYIYTNTTVRMIDTFSQLWTVNQLEHNSLALRQVIIQTPTT